MTTVKDLLTIKGKNVLTVSQSMTVLDAILSMNEHSVGAVVVTDPDGAVSGIFTERDVLRRVLGERLDPANTRVSDVMTTEVVCGQLDTLLEEVQALMQRQRIRHLPIVDNTGRLEGLISIGDVNAHHANNREVHIHYLHEYLYGRV